MKAITAIIASYIIGFVVIYGHAFNARPNHYLLGEKVVESIVISMAWPLYASVKLWEKGVDAK